MSQSMCGETAEDIVDILTWDHREMIELLDQIVSTSREAERRDLTDMAIAELLRHAIAEELFVYPAIEEHVPDGAAQVDHDRQEHDEMILILRDLENLAASDARFLNRVWDLEAELQHHAANQELDQFPRLRAHIPRDILIELANQVQGAKRLAPTRPHPHAPHSQLLQKSIGSGAGMIDRLRASLIGQRVG